MRDKKKIAESCSKKSKGRKKVYALLTQYKKRFRINHLKYKITFVRGKEVADYYAEVTMHGSHVRICFNEDLMDKRPTSLEDTVVHELLHVVMYKLLDKAHAIVKAYVRGASDKQRLENRFEKLEHGIIDKLMPAIMKG